MKTLLKLILIFLFAALTPLVALLVVIRTDSVTPATIKSQLIQNGIYRTLTDKLDTYIDSRIQDNTANDPLVLIGPYVEKEITPAYIQAKAETLIDDTDAWLSGKSNRLPVVSFNDIRDDILSQNAGLVNQLKAMNNQYAKAKPDLQEQMDEAAAKDLNATPAPKLPDFDINTVLNKNLNVPVGSYIRWLKPVVWLAGTGFFLCILLLVLMLWAILALSDTVKSKLRFLSLTAFFSGLANVIPFILAGGGTIAVTAALTSSDSIPSYVTPFLEALVKPFLLKYTALTGGLILTFGVIAIGFFIASFFGKNNPPPAVSPKRK
jgi:hypothetical protein